MLKIIHPLLVGSPSALLKKIQLTLLCFFVVFLSAAQIPTRYAYSETFSMAEGLEHSVIADMRTDQNDLVWIAVGGTLQLFDGDQFVDMGHLVHSSNSSGSFGFENGNDLFLIKQHILYKFTSKQYTSKEAPTYVFPTYSRRDPPPKIIYEDRQYLYISHPNDSLYQIEKKALTLKKKFRLQHKSHPNYRWSSIYLSPHPVTAVQYIDSNYHRCIFDLTTEKTTIDHTCPNLGRGALASGDTILSLTSNHLEIYTAGRKHLITLPEPSNDFTGEYFLLSGRNQVYVTLRNAIYLFDLRSFTWISRIQRSGGLPLSDIKMRQLLLDKAGHLYFSTFNTGLVKMYPSNGGFQYIGLPGNKKHFIKCIRVSEKNNLVLAGTLQDGLLVFDTNGVLKHQILHSPDPKGYRFVSAILKISDSRYILFSDKMFELTFNGNQYQVTQLKDSGRNWATYYDNAVEDSRYNRYFIFNHRQVIEIRPGDAEPLQTITQPYIGSSIAATLSDGGYVMSGLDELIFFDQALSRHPVKFNVPDFGYSRCLVPYSPGQYLVATDLGLFLLDTLKNTAPHAPIYDRLVYSILPGNEPKEFWFSTDYGLYRLDESFHFKRFSIESGLQENEFNTNSCYKTESGKLYFGGVNGITAFYPSQIGNEEDKPLPYISILSVNGKVRERYIAPGAPAMYTLASDENVIQLRLLGKGLRSSRNYNYQYMVTGLHEGWINLGTNMDIQLQLNPGRYTIYYHIADRFEPLAETLYSLQLDINPPLYRRWWFVIVLSLIPLYFLYYIMNLRRKRQAVKVRYELELDRKLHDERMRISRDLHDNIGAQMATVKRNINFLIHQNDRLSPQQAMQKMQDLEGISTQINQELRDTIWAVQHEHIDVAGFITRLKNYIFQLLGPDSIYRIHYEEHGDTQLVLGPFVALNLHRICQEAINNILKHAEANEIRIIVDSRDSSLKVSIADNGKGFDPEDISEGYGLGNIRKRAEQIGAEVYFNRLNPEGSSIEIRIMKPFVQVTDKKVKDGKD